MELPVYGDSTRIDFNSSAATPTKAPVIDGNNITNFKVSANLPQSSLPGQQTLDSETGFNFFERINVLRRDTNGHWGYSPSLYWPAKDDAVSFYAYSPAASVNVNGFSSQMNDGVSPRDNALVDYLVPNEPGPTITGSKPSGAKLPEDFLIAVKKQALAKGDTVRLDFRHALSMATFAARNTTKDLNVTIEKVQLINLDTHGKLDLAQDFSKDDIYWVDQSSTADYTAGIPLQSDGSYAISLPPKGPNSSYISLTAPTEQMPVLPQGFYVGSTSRHILKKGEAEPTSPGILVTYRASTTLQIVASPGTRAYYPFPALYQGNNYQGKPDFSGVGNLNSFAFQMGKRYQFTFDFDGGSYPRIEFSVGSIDDYDSTQIVPTPPALQLLTDGTERTDTLLSGLEHLQIPVGTVRTNQQTWTAEVTSGGGWLNVDIPMGYDGDSLRISTRKNQTGVTRVGTITLYADTAKRVFTVTQEAYDGAGELTTFSVPTNTGTYQFDVAFIPKGKFWTGMKKGSGTEVTLTKDYYLGTTEVTNAQYAAFLNDMGVDSTGTMPGDTLWIGDSKNATNGWKWSVTYVNGQWQPMPGYDNYPVYAVSWYGAVAYCNWLDSKISGYHFSLPTEAQWERAALCGTPYAYNGMGDTWNDSYGWGTTNSGGHPHDVGTSTSNIWNIYDMHGNIWEWCSDYVGTYPSSTTDPTGSISGTNHVIVSGSWDDGVYKSDAVYLNGWPAGAPGINSWDLGFRICAIKDPTHIATPLGGTIRKVSVNTTSGALNFQLAFIPKGKFLSGTTTGTEITLTKDYYMGTTEVTNAQFAAFLNDAGIGQDGKMPNDSVGVQDSKLYKSTANSTLSPWGLTWSTTTNKWEPCSGYDNFPAIEVNWYGAKAYCDWLNTKRPGLIFKLPTEAQWQYADQSGTQYEYNGLSSTWNNDYGWTSENSSAHTHEIGTALQGKNRWNLQDMSGNVREWCNDWYNSTYPYPTATDPVGAASSTDRVRRGNCWYYNAANSPAHVRGSYSPMTGLLDHYGFRVCAMAN